MEKNLLTAAQLETARARTLFPDPAHLLHALTEEHGEVVKAALNLYEGKGTYEELDKEIVQLIAMCIRLHEEGDPAINLDPVYVMAERWKTLPLVFEKEEN